MAHDRPCKTNGPIQHGPFFAGRVCFPGCGATRAYRAGDPRPRPRTAAVVSEAPFTTANRPVTIGSCHESTFPPAVEGRRPRNQKDRCKLRHRRGTRNDLLTTNDLLTKRSSSLIWFRCSFRSTAPHSLSVADLDGSDKHAAIGIDDAPPHEIALAPVPISAIAIGRISVATIAVGRAGRESAKG